MLTKKITAVSLTLSIFVQAECGQPLTERALMCHFCMIGVFTHQNPIFCQETC